MTALAMINYILLFFLILLIAINWFTVDNSYQPAQATLFNKPTYTNTLYDQIIIVCEDLAETIMETNKKIVYPEESTEIEDVCADLYDIKYTISKMTDSDVKKELDLFLCDNVDLIIKNMRKIILQNLDNCNSGCEEKYLIYMQSLATYYLILETLPEHRDLVFDQYITLSIGILIKVVIECADINEDLERYFDGFYIDYNRGIFSSRIIEKEFNLLQLLYTQLFMVNTNVKNLLIINKLVVNYTKHISRRSIL